MRQRVEKPPRYFKKYPSKMSKIRNFLDNSKQFLIPHPKTGKTLSIGPNSFFQIFKIQRRNNELD